jgi:hypothetical protein
LRGLKERYREIVGELAAEETANIQAATLQVLQSEDFRRLSLQSASRVLTQRIVDIREEYRHVLQLLRA